MDRSQLEDLLAGVVRTSGSSLHLLPNHVPYVRVADRIVPSEMEAVSPQVVLDLMRDFLFEDHREQLARGEEVEILYSTTAGVRFRTTIMRQRDGMHVVFRKLPEQVPSFEELGLPPVLASLTGFRRGIVLLTGFFGSGKSTTLAALVDRLNEESAMHIETVEQPIEFIHQSKKSLIHQREVGTHVDRMAIGVRDAYRQGAEVIVVDGVADLDTFLAVLEAVERGCFVIATLDASSVTGAITDITKLVPAEQRPMVLFRFAKLLRAVVSQSLINRLHGNGRVPVLEIMIRTRAVAHAIRDGQFQDLPELMRRGKGLGMQTNDQALRSLLSHNMIAADEAAYHAIDRDWVMAR